jgi:hypothetical protein
VAVAWDCRLAASIWPTAIDLEIMMAQVFHPVFNTLSRATLAAIALGPVLVLVTADQLQRSQYASGSEIATSQPVPFSHQHHVAGLGIDCRYCHTSVEKSAFAGIPPASTCMSCHREVWSDAPLLAPIRASFSSKQPVPWRRVHDLPDYVYFDHSVHLAKGVGCVSCHGRVDEMPLMWLNQPLTMSWCLDCHRAPERHLRPKDTVTIKVERMGPDGRASQHEVVLGSKLFDLTWRPQDDGLTQDEVGKQLVDAYQVKRLTHCSVCHR